MEPRILEIIESHQATLEATRALAPDIAKATQIVVDCLRGGHQLLLAGNGGSAGDAQHIAGEYVGRFLMERRAMPAIALNTNSTIITAIGNDYAYDRVFARQVEAFGKPGDVLIAITTSGTSPNIIEAIKTAREQDMRVIGWTGATGGKMKDMCDVCLCVPSSETPRVQEMHIMIGHMICELSEKALC